MDVVREIMAKSQLQRILDARARARLRKKARGVCLPGHLNVCCQYHVSNTINVVPWDWDENNDRVCAKCGRYL